MLNIFPDPLRLETMEIDKGANKKATYRHCGGDDANPGVIGTNTTPVSGPAKPTRGSRNLSRFPSFALASLRNSQHLPRTWWKLNLCFQLRLTRAMSNAQTRSREKRTHQFGKRETGNKESKRDSRKLFYTNTRAHHTHTHLSIPRITNSRLNISHKQRWTYYVGSLSLVPTFSCISN